jgi:hypothetical protein
MSCDQIATPASRARIRISFLPLRRPHKMESDEDHFPLPKRQSATTELASHCGHRLIPTASALHGCELITTWVRRKYGAVARHSPVRRTSYRRPGDDALLVRSLAIWQNDLHAWRPRHAGGSKRNPRPCWLSVFLYETSVFWARKHAADGESARQDGDADGGSTLRDGDSPRKNAWDAGDGDFPNLKIIHTPALAICFSNPGRRHARTIDLAACTGRTAGMGCN